MKPWLRLAIITLTIGGGFTGFSITLQQLLKPQSDQALYLVVVLVFLALYAFVLGSGIAFVHNQQRIRPLLIAFAIQVPWISSEIITYKFTAGFHATIGVIGGGFTGGFSVGSAWLGALFQRSPFGIGVNLFALLMVIVLAQPARAIPDNVSGPHPLQ